MKRVKFKKGEQRKFMQKVLNEINCPSLRVFLQFGLGIPYSTLKNYFIEERLLPKDLFENMCYLSKINLNDLDFKFIEGNFGQVLGGKKSRK